MMVADGVGGGLKGEQASRMALEVTTKYLAEGARCYYRFDEEGVDLVQALEEGALRCSEAIQERAAQDESAAGMATTLTLFIGVWPWTYLLQVGDSRYYQFHRSEEHTSELQSLAYLVCRLLLEKKKKNKIQTITKKQKKQTKQLIKKMRED